MRDLRGHCSLESGSTRTYELSASPLLALLWKSPAHNADCIPLEPYLWCRPLRSVYPKATIGIIARSTRSRSQARGDVMRPAWPTWSSPTIAILLLRMG